MRDCNNNPDPVMQTGDIGNESKSNQIVKYIGISMISEIFPIGVESWHDVCFGIYEECP